jgi:hypothetical protein
LPVFDRDAEAAEAEEEGKGWIQRSPVEAVVISRDSRAECELMDAKRSLVVMRE